MRVPAVFPRLAPRFGFQPVVRRRLCAVAFEAANASWFMKGMPWHVRGVHPNARDSAREAARRAGMSVGEWLNSVILDSPDDSAPTHGHDHQRPDYPGHPNQGPAPSQSYARFESPYAPRPSRGRQPSQREAARREYDRLEFERRESERRVQEERVREARAYEAAREREARAYEARAAYDARDYEPPFFPQDPIIEEVAAIHDRLEGLSEGIESLMRSTSASRGNWHDQDATSQHLSAAIAKLDQRVDHLIHEGRTASKAIERRVDSVASALSSLGRSRSIGAGSNLSPGIDQTVAEITMRQRELDGDAGFGRSRAGAREQSVPDAREHDMRVRDEPVRHDFAGVEDKLRYITEQIDTLGPGRMHDAINALRNDLAEIARTLTEASPRRAIEALEGEVRVLVTRLDSRSRAGAGTPALATLEKGLAEVRDTLRGLTPAESLSGAVDAIHALSHKIDQMASGRQQDPAALEQLETAISGLRSIVSNVASNDALSTLAGEVRALSERIDNGPAATRGNDILKTLESRIGMIADAIESVRASGSRDSSPDIDAMVRTLGDKIERLQDTRGIDSGIGQLDARITKLVQKLEASETRLGSLDSIERGMKELLGYIAELRGGVAGPAAPVPVQAIAKDVRRAEESLEAVHDTIGDVVERLAMIETGMRGHPDRPAAPAGAPVNPPLNTPARPAAQPYPAQSHPAPQRSAPAMQPQPMARPSPPQAPIPHAQPAAAVASYSMQAQVRAPEMPRAAPMPTPQPPRPAVAQQMRPAADGSLPYDFPLEPGSGKPRPGMVTPATGSAGGSSIAAFRSPAERIAASKASLEPAAMPPDDKPKSNFIEAARRAAQFAAESQVAAGAAEFKHAPDVEPAPVSLLARVRKHAKSVLIGASVLVLLAAGIHMAVGFFGLNEQAPEAPRQQSKLVAPDSLARQAPQAASVASGTAGQLPQPADPFGIVGDEATHAMSPASGIGAQASLLSPQQVAAPKTIQVPEYTMAAAPGSGIAAPTPRRLVPPPADLFNPAIAPRAAVLPPSIGGRALVAAAESGDAAAAFEVAVRYSEGRGVTASLEETAAWFERAARAGLTPAIFRLGGLYEKGIGVKKDLKRARALYTEAANRGSAKAMHNLAVLYAEGSDSKPDYQNALTWFRKAADRGVADSQFNLGVLYARGIGMEPNFAESYKWFALAALGGDRDAAQKRDDIASRVDAQTLTATRAGIRDWKPQPQPDDAVSVHAPPGGWDQAPPPPDPAKAKVQAKGKQPQGMSAATSARTL